MLVTQDGRDARGSSMAKAQLIHRTGAASARVQPTIPEEPSDSTDHDEYLGSCDTEGDEEGEYEEYDEFSQLPDTRSIASDDSFYPPEDFDDLEDLDPERSPSVESETSLMSFFQACSSNQVLMVKLMIRRGVTEDEVQETDKNNRVSVGGHSVKGNQLVVSHFKLNGFRPKSYISLCIVPSLDVLSLPPDFI